MAIKFYELSADWGEDGNTIYDFVDLEGGGFESDDDYCKVAPLQDKWEPPMLHRLRDGERAEVYYCPGRYFFFRPTRLDRLIGLTDGCCEWLPALVDGEEFILPHPLVAIPFGSGARFRKDQETGNVIEVYRHDTDVGIDDLPPMFFFDDPPESAAGKAGYCGTRVFVANEAARELQELGLTGITLLPHPAESR